MRTWGPIWDPHGALYPPVLFLLLALIKPGEASHIVIKTQPPVMHCISHWAKFLEAGVGGCKNSLWKKLSEPDQGGSSSQLACIFMLVIISRSWMHILVLSGGPLRSIWLLLWNKENIRIFKTRKNNN